MSTREQGFVLKPRIMITHIPQSESSSSTLALNLYGCQTSTAGLGSEEAQRMKMDNQTTRLYILPRPTSLNSGYSPLHIILHIEIHSAAFDVTIGQSDVAELSGFSSQSAPLLLGTRTYDKHTGKFLFLFLVAPKTIP
jgi:hypothetical protein